MVVHLHRVSVCLESEAAVVRQYWQRLFAGWLAAGSSAAQARLRLSLVDALPALPNLRPFFEEAASVMDGVRLLAAYRWEKGVLLDYGGGARVQVPLAGERPYVRGEVLPRLLAYGGLEDITFTSLAPCLRRHGYFLVHAFGAGRGDRCVLVVGPSGSGKTTTGLSLVLAGWELLANDVLLIEWRPDGVYALPTPGGLSIREETLRLLPDCRSLLSDAARAQDKYELTNQQVLNGRRPDPRRVSAIYFCQVEERERAEIRPLSQAMALARLMEQSVDRWDEGMLGKHIGVLQELSQQAEAYSLRLGRDVWRLPELLASSE